HPDRAVRSWLGTSLPLEVLPMRRKAILCGAPRQTRDAAVCWQLRHPNWFYKRPGPCPSGPPRLNRPDPEDRADHLGCLTRELYREGRSIPAARAQSYADEHTQRLQFRLSSVLTVQERLRRSASQLTD